MKRVKVLFVLLLVIVLLFGCFHNINDKRYVCDIEQVKCVQIVQLDGHIQEEYRYTYSVLAEITDNATFIERLTSMDQGFNHGTPSTLQFGYVVIKIDYFNGDYDIIYSNVQMIHRSGVNEYCRFCFDMETFNALIADYYSSVSE